MALSPNFQAQADAWGKQYDQQQDAEAAKQNPNAAEVLPTSVFHWMNSGSVGRATLSGIDAAVGTAENMWNSGSQVVRKGRDLAAGAITGGVNIADAAHSFAHGVSEVAHDAVDVNRPVDQAVEESISQEGPAAAARMKAIDQEAPSSPVWDHAKNAILDFRDAVAVKDPTLSDNLVQAVGQLAIPFAGYSRLLAGLHGVASVIAAGALTDSTALTPHATRLADLIALERHTDGKLGEALRTLAPDGSAVNAYINFLTDRSNETEAEGRFKNVLDGFGANLIATPLLHGAAVVLKQGAAGLRYALENGVTSASDLAPKSLHLQRGAVGDIRVQTAPAESAPPPKVEYSNERGFHAALTPNGYTHAVETGDNDLRVLRTDTDETARGRGEATARMERLAAEAAKRGGRLVSDVSVSPEAERVYEALQRRGYKVERNPNAIRNEATGNLISDDPRTPVFTVGPKEKVH